MSFWKSIYINNGFNNNMIKIDWLMDYSFLILFFITILVFLLFIIMMNNYFINNIYYEFPNLELFWTILPGILIFLISFPSLNLLYNIEEKLNQNITFKTTGHQWYWNYDFFNKINFDSYMESSTMFSARNLETDNHLILPVGVNMNIITSEDVIHSWSIPSLGLKMDSNPGRLNSLIFNSSIPGIYYGQCSEICGANHSFMPIVLEVTPFFMFKQWLINLI